MLATAVVLALTVALGAGPAPESAAVAAPSGSPAAVPDGPRAAAPGASVSAQASASAETSAVASGTATSGAPRAAAPAVGQAGRAAKPGSPQLAPPRTNVTFYLGLKRSDAAAQKALKAVSDPTSPQYRKFPDRRSIRSSYGASAQTVRAVATILKKFGITVDVDASGVFAGLTGTALAFRRWLGKAVVLLRGPLQHTGTALVMAVDVSGLPPLMKGLATSFVPLDYETHYFDLQASGMLQGFVQAAQIGKYNGGSPTGCLSAAANAIIYSYNQLRTAYGFDTLPTDVGTSVRMAIISQGNGFADEQLAQSARCFDLPDVNFTRVPAGGLRGNLPEGPEGDLDTQVAQAMLPAGSAVTVIEQAGHDQRTFLSYAAVFALPDLPDVTTNSYGNCEPQLQSFDTPLTESLLLRLALAGTSNFAAAGDSGSSDCVDQDTGIGPRRLAVDYTPSSPYVTAVGGSRITLTAQNTRASEVVWNDSKLQAPPEAPANVGGGGGHSVLFARPWWQTPVSRSPGRTVPDLTAHASGVAAWPISRGPLITPTGGTSAASPFVASAFAIMAAQQRASGGPPLGLVNPLLYWLQKYQPKTFYDIVSGTNDVYGVGCCSAVLGYDPASGLGAPAVDQIAGHVPAPGGVS